MIDKIEKFINLFYFSKKSRKIQDWSYWINSSIQLIISFNLILNNLSLVLLDTNHYNGRLIKFRIININGNLNLVENYLNRQHGRSLMYCSDINEFIGENQEDLNNFLNELKLKYI